jgi:hypothetical protein
VKQLPKRGVPPEHPLKHLFSLVRMAVYCRTQLHQKFYICSALAGTCDLLSCAAIVNILDWIFTSTLTSAKQTTDSGTISLRAAPDDWSTDIMGCTSHGLERVRDRVTLRHKRARSLHHHSEPRSHYLTHRQADGTSGGTTSIPQLGRRVWHARTWRQRLPSSTTVKHSLSTTRIPALNGASYERL